MNDFKIYKAKSGEPEEYRLQVLTPGAHRKLHAVGWDVFYSGGYDLAFERPLAEDRVDIVEFTYSRIEKNREGDEVFIGYMVGANAFEKLGIEARISPRLLHRLDLSGELREQAENMSANPQRAGFQLVEVTVYASKTRQRFERTYLKQRMYRRSFGSKSESNTAKRYMLRGVTDMLNELERGGER
tara:strand:- start:1290 stop:1847 length:558 start_codon:yes stop_codon:yes gene_type:complete